MVREILVWPHPVLKQKAQPVAAVDDSTRALIKDLFDSMYAADGVGLAAPQIGVLKNVIVLDTTPRQPEAKPLAMVNPEILTSEGKVEYKEGCLSIPGEAEDVDRAAIITVRFLDEQGVEQTLKCDGLLAIAVSLRCGSLALATGGWRPAIAAGLAGGIGYLARPEVILAPAAVGLAGLWPLLRRLELRRTLAARVLPALGLSALVVVGGYALVKGQVDLHDNGYVKVAEPSTRTNLAGVFAIGDLVDHTYRQAITAAGSGCRGALDAEWYLRDTPPAIEPAEAEEASVS